MQTFFKKLQPKDIIAVIILLCGFYLLAKGIDHIVGGVVIAVTTYYFVVPRKHDNTKNSQSQ